MSKKGCHDDVRTVYQSISVEYRNACGVLDSLKGIVESTEGSEGWY